MSSDLFIVQMSPNSILDYTMDWAAGTSGAGDSDWLAEGETISTSTWFAQDGLVIGDGVNGAPVPSNTTTTATVWFVGQGINMIDRLATNRIVTNSGRQHERSLLVQVRTR